MAYVAKLNLNHDSYWDGFLFLPDVRIERAKIFATKKDAVAEVGKRYGSFFASTAVIYRCLTSEDEHRLRLKGNRV